jgi:hypothetical protein
VLFDEGKSIGLQTRKGRDIRNLQKPQILPHRVRLTEGFILDAFPEVDRMLLQMRREPTATYNCHGLTFASRRTGIYDLDDLKLILLDDGYKRITDEQDVRVGDIVLYMDLDNLPVHSGIVVTVADQWIGDVFLPTVLSKWGEGGGEYLHRVDNAPYRNVRYHYFREGQYD